MARWARWPLGAATVSTTLVVVAGAMAGAGWASAGTADAAPFAVPRAKPLAADTSMPTIGVDLGAGLTADHARQVRAAMQLYLDQFATTKVTLNFATTRSCQAAATMRAAQRSTVAVISVGETGCMPSFLPKLAALGDAAPLLVSATDSDPSLTRTWAGVAPLRTRTRATSVFARVVPPLDYQGAAAATFAMSNLRLRRCAVLDDGSMLGKATASRFAAGRLGRSDGATQAVVPLVGELPIPVHRAAVVAPGLHIPGRIGAEQRRPIAARQGGRAR